MRLLSELYDGERLRSGDVDGDRIAFSDGVTRLAWTDTVDRIAQLASVLLELGVSPGDRVGIRRPKSIESFIGVHAILRAGAVMVPLDALAPAAHTHAPARFDERERNSPCWSVLSIFWEVGARQGKGISSPLLVTSRSYDLKERVAPLEATTVVN